MKIFQYGDEDWFAAETFAACATFVTDHYSDEWFDSTGLVELTPERCDELIFTDTERGRNDDGEYFWMTFNERLAEMIADGETFPCFFASTEF
jgi:hypothetical protein